MTSLFVGKTHASSLQSTPSESACKCMVRLMCICWGRCQDVVLASLTGRCVAQRMHCGAQCTADFARAARFHTHAQSLDIGVLQHSVAAALVFTSAANVVALLPKTAPVIPNTGLDLKCFQDHPI
jgi:hypothetical protein